MLRILTCGAILPLALTGCNDEERAQWGTIESRFQSLTERLTKVTTMMSKLDAAQNASHEELVKKVGTLEARLGAMERMLLKHPPRKKGTGVASDESRALAAANETMISKIDVSSHEVKVHRSVWAGLRSKPGILRWGMRMVPHELKNEASVFRVIGVRSGSVPAAFGFQLGDILLKINGKPPRSTAKDTSPLGALLTPGGGSITVDRGGKRSPGS